MDERRGEGRKPCGTDDSICRCKDENPVDIQAGLRGILSQRHQRGVEGDCLEWVLCRPSFDRPATIGQSNTPPRGPRSFLTHDATTTDDAGLKGHVKVVTGDEDILVHPSNAVKLRCVLSPRNEKE